MSRHALPQRHRNALALLALGLAGCTASSGSTEALACARFRVIDADAAGSLVEDTRTGLTWTRTAYYPGYPPGQNVAQASEHCAAVGMRLPTLAEAQAITPRCREAWPDPWFTWTSSRTDTGQGTGVLHDGFVSSYSESYDGRYGNGDVLCVRDAGTETH